MKKILVAYDGSEPAEKAFDLALDLAGHYRAEVCVFAVARPPEPADDVETEAILENAREFYEKLFAVLRKKASEKDIDPTFEILVGHPAEQIVAYAETKGFDHIVMGHRGKTFFQKWLIGSVAKRVMTYAHCSVTIVKS